MGVIGQCPICVSSLLNSNAFIAGKCGHVFHQPCLTQWFRQQKTCPSCRKKTTEKDVVKLFINEVQLDDSMCSQSMASQMNTEKIVELTEKLSAETSKRTEAQEEVTKLKAKNMSLNNKIQRLNNDLQNASTLAMRIRHLEECLENERVLKQELTALKAKLRACDFYNLLKCEEKGDAMLETFLTPEGNPDADRFLKVVRTQLKKANEKIHAHAAQQQKLKLSMQEQRKKIQKMHELTVDQNEEIRRLKSLLEERGCSPPTPLSALRENNYEPRRPKASLGFDVTPASRSAKRALLESATRNVGNFSYEEQAASDFEEPVAKKARRSPVEFSFECDEDDLPPTSSMPPVKSITALSRVKSTFGTSTFDRIPSLQKRPNRPVPIRTRPNGLEVRRSRPVPASLDESVICLD
uniref:RING-type domain-containing protein n=1 Tax=Panagrellus redivivus TaxID=6233 RepID=A0A7E4VJM8_PANRE